MMGFNTFGQLYLAYHRWVRLSNESVVIGVDRDTRESYREWLTRNGRNTIARRAAHERWCEIRALVRN